MGTDIESGKNNIMVVDDDGKYGKYIATEIRKKQ